MDIRIVGGGAAGFITALDLMERDPTNEWRVTVHETSDEVYTTLCGEGISDATLRHFKAFDSRPYVAESFRGASWWFPGDWTVYVDMPCHTIARSEWIPAMSQEFVKRGGRLKLGAKVTPDMVPAMAEEADVVIGADGPGSAVRKAIGGHAEVKLGVQYRVVDPHYKTDYLEFFTDKRWSDEYAWIFPRGEMWNVGLLGGEKDDWARLDAFMKERGVGGRVKKKEAYPIAFGGDKVQEGNVVLVGDAAGLTNPVTKGGLAAIVYASEILADCIAEGRLAEYGKRIFSHPLTDASLLGALDVLHRYSNRDFERLLRFLPRKVRVGEAPSLRLKVLTALCGLTNPGKWSDVWTLRRAAAVSKTYSW